ncbi:hypothetical protein ABZ721_12250 [Streptomyces sp. NPDC006733]|uniref:hypothetical protein n=1 Tax=Streptomyces sp. NPDC006733 TaxID=3155460 RepID=UPI0033E5DB98
MRTGEDACYEGDIATVLGGVLALAPTDRPRAVTPDGLRHPLPAAWAGSALARGAA